MSNINAAARLLELAERARRLPPPDHRNPGAFHEAREELGAAMVALAHELTGAIGPRPRQSARRRVRVAQQMIGGRLITVQRRRATFALGSSARREADRRASTIVGPCDIKDVERRDRPAMTSKQSHGPTPSA